MRTALHFALQGAHDAAVRAAGFGASSAQADEAERKLKQYADIIRRLAAHPGFDASLGCPIVDALHYRNLQAAEIILHSMSSAQAAFCLTIADAYGQTALHVVAKSKASGFASFFLRWQLANSQAQHARSNAHPFLLRYLRLAEPAGSVVPQDGFSYQDLTAAAGGEDVEFVVRAGAASGVDMQLWLDTVDAAGETAITIACSHGQPPYIVEFLLQARAWGGLSAENAVPEAPVGTRSCGHAAAVGGFRRTLGLWLANGGDPATIDRFNRTVGHVASLTRHELVATVVGVDTLARGCGDSCGWSTIDASLQVGDGGGWGDTPAAVRTLFQPLVQRWISRGLHVDVVEAADLTPLAFVERYRSLSVPVLVRNGCSHWNARSAWHRDSLLADFGSAVVSVGPVPYAQLYGFATKAARSTVEEYVSQHMGRSAGEATSPPARALLQLLRRALEGELGDDDLLHLHDLVPPYLFDPQQLLRDSKLMATVGNLSFVGDGMPGGVRAATLRQWIVGPPLSGAPLHFHGAALNSLVRGAAACTGNWRVVAHGTPSRCGARNCGSWCHRSTLALPMSTHLRG